VRQRVAAAFHFLGKSASQLSEIALVSIRVSLKPSSLLDDFEYPEVKAALTRRSPRRCARSNDVQRSARSALECGSG